jgi:acetyl esterase/lipase
MRAARCGGGIGQCGPVTEPPHVLTRAARAPDLTLRYGPLVDQVIDVRLPRRDGSLYGEPRALVVVIHGGFWRATYDRAHAAAQSAAFADEGYAVATVEYRRVGPRGGGWPETFDDLAEVTDRVPALVDAAVPGGARPKPTVLVGHSAGGQLALWAAARHRLPGSSRWHRSTPLAVAGVLCLAGLSDLVRADELQLGSGATSALLGGGAATHPDRYRTVSPVALLPARVRAVLVHGRDDDVVPVEFSRGYVQRAREAGDAVDLLELPDVGHFELIDPLSAAWPPVLKALTRLTA